MQDFTVDESVGARFGGSWTKIVKPLGWSAIYMHVASYANLYLFTSWSASMMKAKKESFEGKDALSGDTCSIATGGMAAEKVEGKVRRARKICLCEKIEFDNCWLYW
jgi:hypothetical protein